MGELGIVERFLTTLDGIHKALVEHNDLCREALERRGLAKSEPQPAPETPAEAEAEESGLDREALLARCVELGIAVPKGTKTPTLPKLIAKREAELKDAEVKAPAEPAPAEPAASAESDADVFGDDPKPEPELKLETPTDVRLALEKIVGGELQRDHKETLRGLVGRFGATRISEVDQKEWPKVVNWFRAAVTK